MGNKPSSPSSTSLLMEACMANDVDKAKEIVGSACAAASQNNNNNLVGHVEMPDAELVQFINTADPSGNTALHASVFQGNLELVQFLVESCGASITLKNALGCNSLWLAAGYNHEDILEYLLTILDDPLQLLETNTSGDSPILAAASKGNVQACKLLIEYAQKGSSDTERKTLVHDMLLQKNNNNDSPLSVAVAGGHLCGLSESNDATRGQLLDLLLIPNHANHELLNEPNKRGLTPLLVCCERDWLDVFEELLKRGASLNVRDSHGSTPLAVAVFCGSKDICKHLLQCEATLLNVPNDNGCTPLWLAARTAQTDMTRQLLDAGADAEIANKDGLTPLDIATKHEKQDVMTLLEEHQSNNS